MQKILIALLGIAVVCLAGVVGILVQDPATSTLEIDKDRAAVTEQVSSAESEAGKYQGGAIKAILDAKVETLRHTLVMLDQKRSSFIRRVTLLYTIETRQIEPATDAALNDILDELVGAEKRIETTKVDASQYSGGLLKSIKLMTVATEELSAAQLRMKFYTAKYGLPLPTLTPVDANQKTEPPGKVVSDKDAL